MSETLFSSMGSAGKTGADTALEEGCLTPNPFAMMPALVIASPSGHKPSALECLSSSKGLLGIWPMSPAKMLPGLPVMHAPNVPLYQTCGTPMILKGHEEAVLESMVQAIRSTTKVPSVIFAQSMMAEGPVWAALQLLAQRQLIRLDIIEHWERSVLERSAAASGQDYLATQLSANKRKNLKRRTAKLQEHGDVRFSLVPDATDMPAAFERFCKLEASGWKGDNKTALLQHPADKEYIGALLKGMSAAGKAFVAELRQNSRVIASGLFLQAGDELTFLRTAYDETLASYSPGVLFDAMLTEEFYRSMPCRLLDTGSDASVDPETLIWAQRRKMVNVVIDCGDGSISGYAAVAAQRARLWLKQQKKRFRR